MNKTLMTIKGEKKLRNILNILKQTKRPQILKLIKEARKFGDLKENAEYHAAKEEQFICEKKIREIEIKLLNAQIIDISKLKIKNKIIFGSTVTIKNLKNNNIFIYRIVGDDESDIKKKLISINSPLSKQLINKKINDIIIVNTPMGKIKYKILNIKY